jgi:hypothetical protein
MFHFNISIVVFVVLLRDNVYQIAVCLFKVKVRIKTFFLAGGENRYRYYRRFSLKYVLDRS